MNRNIIITTAIWQSLWLSIGSLTQLTTFAISLSSVYCLQKKQLVSIVNSLKELRNLERLDVNLKNLGNDFNTIIPCFAPLIYIKHFNITIVEQNQIIFITLYIIHSIYTQKHLSYYLIIIIMLNKYTEQSIIFLHFQYKYQNEYLFKKKYLSILLLKYLFLNLYLIHYSIFLNQLDSFEDQFIIPKLIINFNISKEQTLERNLSDLLFRFKNLQSVAICLDVNISGQTYENLGIALGNQNLLEQLNFQLCQERTQINLDNVTKFFKKINQLNYLQDFNYSYFSFQVNEDELEIGQDLQIDEQSSQADLIQQFDQAFQYSKELASLMKQKIIINKQINHTLYKLNKQQTYRKDILSQASLLLYMNK